ncbi:MAG: MBL fold metallo-hydrolase [Cyanobacteria bacterium P01_C01_bin.89]
MPKQPQAAFESVFAFSPNRATLGGTSYLILGNRADGVGGTTGEPGPNLKSGNGDLSSSDLSLPGNGLQESGHPSLYLQGNCLIDCPPWDEGMAELLRERGGIDWFVITHRDGIATLKTVRDIQNAFNCRVIIQEQEAYLLPGLELNTFHRDLAIAADLQVIWTPGYSPGSSCVYLNRHGGILFSGRHLLPTPEGKLRPQRQPKTFHWPRQLQHVEALRSRFTAHTLQHCCPGANVGFVKNSAQDTAANSGPPEGDTQGKGTQAPPKAGKAIYNTAYEQLTQSLETFKV